MPSKYHPAPPPASEILSAALALAARGIAVSPMTAAKRPACPHGVRDASTDPVRLAELFNRPGLLPAIACGPASSISVLDIDRQHGGAAWWLANRKRLPATFTYRTRSGGLHLWFQHPPGLRSSVGIIAPGVDVRGTGGSAIYWPAAGFPVLCAAEAAPWPEWLLPPPRPAAPPTPPRVPDDRQLAALIRVVATAPGSQRNGLLFWTSCRMAALVASRLLSHSEAEALLVEAAARAGLPEAESRATARSGLRTGGAS